MPKLFDFVNDLSFDKKDLIREDPYNEKEYLPFMINRAFSFGVDTCLYANEMNKRSELPKLMQHDYYFHSLRKKKRYNKWAKQENTDDIKLVQEYFECNYQKAENILKILKPEELDEIRIILDKGGKK